MTKEDRDFQHLLPPEARETLVVVSKSSLTPSVCSLCLLSAGGTLAVVSLFLGSSNYLWLALPISYAIARLLGRCANKREQAALDQFPPPGSEKSDS